MSVMVLTFQLPMSIKSLGFRSDSIGQQAFTLQCHAVETLFFELADNSNQSRFLPLCRTLFEPFLSDDL